MAKSSIKKSATKKRVVKKKAVRKSTAKKSVVKKKVARKSQKPISKKPVMAGNKIVFKAVLAINDAKALYAELGKKLEIEKDISIDASAVEMADTAILQLFFAFTVEVKSQNRQVIWVKPSDEMMSRVTTLNLQAGLGLDGVV